jgi:hypothetical protein
MVFNATFNDILVISWRLVHRCAVVLKGQINSIFRSIFNIKNYLSLMSQYYIIGKIKILKVHTHKY